MQIAIIGYGLEGESAYHYFLKLYPHAEFSIYDSASEPKKPIPNNVEYIGNCDEFPVISADLIVRSPAVAPSKIKTSGRVTSVTKEFFARCPAPIIGVTGTKGKGTTCSLIAEILRAAGKQVHLVGNIGVPALDVLPKFVLSSSNPQRHSTGGVSRQPVALAHHLELNDDKNANTIIVYELSSFQLWDLEQSPHTAVVLMIEQDHLDVHKDLEDYIAAKANIAKFQNKNDTIVYHPTSQYSTHIAELSRAKKLKYNVDESAHIKNNKIYMQDVEICHTKDILLPGMHNLENVCAAITAAWEYTQDVAAIKKGITSFGGLPHRLKLVAEKKGVKYYDDSIATTPGSAIAAIKAFSEPKVLILGGASKGADFAPLAEALLRVDMRQVILIGQEASRIKKALDTVGFTKYQHISGSMDNIISTAATVAKQGDIVILSPACTSFDMFSGYEARGNAFIQAVNGLAE